MIGNCTEKADSIYNIVSSLNCKPETKDAIISEYRKMCYLDSITLGVKNHRYALSLYDLGHAYYSCREFSKASYYLNKSFDIVTRLTKDNWLKKDILEVLADIAYQNEDYLSAIRYIETKLDIRNDNFDFF